MEDLGEEVRNDYLFYVFILKLFVVRHVSVWLARPMYFYARTMLSLPTFCVWIELGLGTADLSLTSTGFHSTSQPQGFWSKFPLIDWAIQMTIIERPLPGNMKWALLFPPDKQSWSQWLGYSHGHKVQLEGVILDNIYSQQTHHPLSWAKPGPSCTRPGRHNSLSHSTRQQFGQFHFLLHYNMYHLYISHCILFMFKRKIHALTYSYNCFEISYKV